MMTTEIAPIPESSEDIPLAHEIARNVDRVLRVRTEVLGTKPEESLQQLERSCEHRKRQALDGDPKQFSWMDYHYLLKQDPELALQRWTEVKQAAQQELRSGHRAATANEGTLTSDAWQRAQFLAIRDGLADEWKPQNGIERALIDTLAQAFSAQLFWQERMMCYACIEMETEQFKTNECVQHPRVSDTQAVEQAAPASRPLQSGLYAKPACAQRPAPPCPDTRRPQRYSGERR